VRAATGDVPGEQALALPLQHRFIGCHGGTVQRQT